MSAIARAAEGRPGPDEAAEYYSRYIQCVSGESALAFMEQRQDETAEFLATIDEEQSRFRYAEGKWSIRELLNHVTDTERVFAYRALWFARGFESPLPAFDQEVGARNAGAEKVEWAAHVDEFHRVRLATLALFRNLPAAAWARGGVASDRYVSVRALAFIIAGHVEYHLGVLRERYLR